MKKDTEQNFNWSVEHGDYERDEEATSTYLRRKNRKKRIKLFFSILAYLGGVSIITYLILRSL